jgi:hypothetical protein
MPAPAPAVIFKALRGAHSYIGAFTAPALVFFALSGALQTFNLHKTAKGSGVEAPGWIVTLSRIHKDQTAYTAPKKPKATDAPGKASAGDPPPVFTPPSPVPLKIFFLLVSVSLLISTSSGIYMSYRLSRRKAAITLVLVAGALVPLLMTYW